MRAWYFERGGTSLQIADGTSSLCYWLMFRGKSHTAVVGVDSGARTRGSLEAANVVNIEDGLDDLGALCADWLVSLAGTGVKEVNNSLAGADGHLLIVGINPWSSWGLRHVFAHDGLRQARCISPSRVGDWLNLLGICAHGGGRCW